MHELLAFLVGYLVAKFDAASVCLDLLVELYELSLMEKCCLFGGCCGLVMIYLTLVYLPLTQIALKVQYRNKYNKS